jgi:hypothetical protein
MHALAEFVDIVANRRASNAAMSLDTVVVTKCEAHYAQFIHEGCVG